jgi:hypothetical protein
MPINKEVNIMYEVNMQVYNSEHAKDLYREAENERLARSVRNENGAFKNARKALGNGLINFGQSLLKQD